MTLPETPRDAVTETVLDAPGVAAVFPPRVADTIGGALGAVVPFIDDDATDRVQVRIAARASLSAADTARDVADRLLERFPHAGVVRVQVDRIH